MLYSYSMLSFMAITLTLGILFIFLSRQSKTHYMSYWGLCWLIYSLVFLLDFFNLQIEDEKILYLQLRQILLLIDSWLFLKGTCCFFQGNCFFIANLAFGVSLFLSVLSLWCLPLFPFIIVPNIIVISSLLVSSGCMFISYSWTQNLPEKLVASFLIILWAFFINHFGLAFSHIFLATITYYLCIIIVTILMLLLMIIHFKKSHFLDNRQTARFRLLVENSSDMMFLFNYNNKKFEYLSPHIQNSLGVSSQQLYINPERFFDCIETSRSYKNVLSIFTKKVKGSGNATFALVNSGQIMGWSEVHYNPIIDQTGSVTAVEGIIRDITERKKVEQKLIETQKAKEDFVENITHEIKTPITLIRGYAESILENIVPQESIQTYSQMILSKSIMLNALLEDLKQLSNFSSQDLEYKFYETPAKKYFEEAIAQCRFQIEQTHNFKFSLDIDDDIILIIDPHRILQVITNLVNNALRHTPLGSEIFISCSFNKLPVFSTSNIDSAIPAGALLFKITDTGDGIISQDLPHIFERGFIGKNQIGSSSGLGLYISRQIISQHSGLLTAENNPQKGATFIISLPYYK